MKKISLNDIDKSRNNDNGEYQLDPTEKYVINLEEELQFQTAIMTSFQIMGAPPALKNYHAWLFKNNFSYEIGNKAGSVLGIEWHIVCYETCFRVKIVFAPSLSTEICFIIIIVIWSRTIEFFTAGFTFIYQFL